MDAEAAWKTNMETNVQKISTDVAQVASHVNELRNLKSELETYTAQLRNDLDAEIQNAVTAEVAARQPLPDSEADHTAAMVQPVMMTEGIRPPAFFQKPPKYKEGEDPETFILFYDLLANGNKWTELESAQRLPTYFPLSLLPWYISLEDDIKMNYGRLKASFIERFDLGNDKQQLLIDYHDLRAKNCPSLGDYANRVQSIGLKLNKSTAENLLQFKLGLPVPMFRWIDERRPRTIENALRLAMDFDAMFGRGSTRYVPSSMNVNSGVTNEVVRVEEAMEHIQRITPANDRSGGRGTYQRNRVFSSRNPNTANTNQYRPTGTMGNRNGHGGSNRGGHVTNTGGGRGGSSAVHGNQGAGRQPHLRNYQLEDETGPGRDDQLEEVQFTAEWFRDSSGNEDLPVAQNI